MPEYYSVALIGSSGGGTATLGHTDPIELLETVNKELLNIHDKNDTRMCIGISYAIFVCLDGGGFDAVRNEKDWVPDDNIQGDNLGPPAALYTVGFDNSNSTSNNNDASTSTSMNQFTTSNDITSNNYVSMSNQFKVKLVDTGPLVKINRLAIKLDLILAETIKTEDCTIKAMVSISSEPTKIHTASLKACSRIINFPIVGSGGTSLSQIASLYDLRIVGNSGGSVASSTLTKAKGWATGLSEEWNMRYDEKDVSEANEQKNEDKQNTSQSPTLKSILESALPCFLFVCISLHLINALENRYGMDSATSCIWDEENDNMIDLNSPLSIIKYALRHIVVGTTCCVLVATTTGGSSVDQSTLLMSATVAGVLSSASTSQLLHSRIGSGSALVGLFAGVLTTRVMMIVSNLCHKYHVTATMTNILCGGGVGTLVGSMIHISGLAHVLRLLTGIIRCAIRWRVLAFPVSASPKISVSTIPLLLPYGLIEWVLPVLFYIQDWWLHLASRPSLSILFHEYVPGLSCTEHLPDSPVPIGLGFLYGCIFV